MRDLVVKVVDGSPLDLLSDIFLLLSLEGELDEDLLHCELDREGTRSGSSFRLS